jgi:DNA-binding response OmpR family regulator
LRLNVPQPTPANGRTPVILCIDDEPNVLELRRKLLDAAGYSVLAAPSPAEGIQLFRANHVDLVLLDYWMADMNGLAVALELKRINSNVPLVMFSGFRCILDEALGRVDEWLIKGETRPADLLRTIRKLLSRNGQSEA